jgi:hypothetical protein
MSQGAPILPDNFDWISARSICTPAQVMQRLRLQIEDDVEKRKALMTPNEKAKCDFSTTYEGRKLTVMVEGEQLWGGVTFSLLPTGIAVHDMKSEDLLYEAKLTLSNDGDCKLKVGDTEYNLWQFRKLTLEDVLFTSVAKWRP